MRRRNRDGASGGEKEREREVGSRRKYRLFYYAKAFSAVGSFRLRAVALPIESQSGGGGSGGGGSGGIQ